MRVDERWLVDWDDASVDAEPWLDFAQADGKTTLTQLNGSISGELFNLPAGEVRAAFGFNATRETFYTPGNPDAANGLITQQGGSWFDGKRNTYALFV